MTTEEYVMSPMGYSDKDKQAATGLEEDEEALIQKSAPRTGEDDVVVGDLDAVNLN